MLRPNYRDAIAQAIADINRNPGLSELSQSAMKQAVVLRVLDAAGWSPYSLSDIEPDFPIGSSKVDYALKLSPAPRSQAPAVPKVLVDVRSLEENLNSERVQRRLVNHCERVSAELGVLTNGPRWLLFLGVPDPRRQENRFCELNIVDGQESAADELNRYLAKDKVGNGQAVRSAEGSLRTRNQDEVFKVAVIEGWRQVVKGLDEGLVAIIATAAEQRLGTKPDHRFIRRVLNENREELLAASVEGEAAVGVGSGARIRPSSFAFESEVRSVRSWPELLVEVCLAMQRRHPDDFDKIMGIGGRKNPYFSRDEGVVNHARAIGDTGIFASCQGSGDIITRRAQRVVQQFGYSPEALVIETR